MGLFNRTRTDDDADLAPIKPLAPIPHNPLAEHDVTITVDGKRISTTFVDIRMATDGNKLMLYFETTLEAALNPEVNAVENFAWAGFHSGDVVEYIEPGMPVGGHIQLRRVKPGAKDGEPSIFVGLALTDVVSMSTGKVLARPNDEVEIDVVNVRKQYVPKSRIPL